MTTSTTSDNWTSTKAKLKHKFDKFTDENLDAFKDSMDGLSAKLQSVYGYAKDRADKEVADFKSANQSK